MMRVYHTLKPVCSSSSKVLILGSIPSVKSREEMKYYAHPQNRFWKVLSIIYGEDASDWQSFILKHNLALWDVIEECDIASSSDASIKNVKPTDIKWLLNNSNIEYIVLLGKKAYDLYNKYTLKTTGISGIYLNSPSSANASASLNDLVEEYKIIKELSEK